jgi:hypothetical protein
MALFLDIQFFLLAEHYGIMALFLDIQFFFAGGVILPHVKHLVQSNFLPFAQFTIFNNDVHDIVFYCLLFFVLFFLFMDKALPPQAPGTAGAGGDCLVVSVSNLWAMRGEPWCPKKLTLTTRQPQCALFRRSI